MKAHFSLSARIDVHGLCLIAALAVGCSFDGSQLRALPGSGGIAEADGPTATGGVEDSDGAAATGQPDSSEGTGKTERSVLVVRM